MNTLETLQTELNSFREVQQFASKKINECLAGIEAIEKAEREAKLVEIEFGERQEAAGGCNGVDCG